MAVVAVTACGACGENIPTNTRAVRRYTVQYHLPGTVASSYPVLQYSYSYSTSVHRKGMLRPVDPDDDVPPAQSLLVTSDAATCERIERR